MLVTINTASAGTFYESDADYGFSNGVMTDNTNLTYETNINGVVTVNDERFLAFALKGTYAGTDYTYTSMDYEWTWTHTVDGTDHTFEAINNNDNFVWKQYWYFHENEPMKIEHYLKNNYPQSITDMEMYYITSVDDTDTIQYDGNDYQVGDVKPIFIQKDLNDIEASINFNDEYDFNFLDIVSEGFDINEFYLGSGSVIGYPAIDIMAVGFTKNNGIFPAGAEVWIDPTFSTNVIESVATCPLSNNSYILAWGDETDDNKYFKIMWINGTTRVDTTSIGDHGSVSLTSLDVVALNSTHWIYVYKNEDGDDVYADIYNVGSKITTLTIDLDVGYYSNSFAVDAANETRWGVVWQDDVANKLYYALYDYDTQVGSNVEVADLDRGYAQDIFFFNDTHHGITWFDSVPEDVFFAIYENETKIGNTTTVDTWVDSSYAVKGIAVTDTILTIAYNDDGSYDHSFHTYYSNGTSISGEIDVNSNVGAIAASIGLTKKNSTHIYIGVNDDDSDDPYLALYHYDGTEVYNLDKGIMGLDYIDVGSSKHATGIGLDDENVVMMWVESSSRALWGYYYANGTLYDVEAPAYVNQSYTDNTSEVSCDFSIQYTENNSLGYHIFATNNTGVWVNDSAILFTTSPETITTSKTINSTIGLTIGYRWYANDSTGLEGNTPVYTLLTSADVILPTYSGASTSTAGIDLAVNFSLDVNDNLALESNGKYMFSTNNSGTWVNSSWSNFTSTPETIFNNTLTLNSTLETIVGYRWYLHDDAGNYNNTSIYTLTTTVWGSNATVTNGLGDVGYKSKPNVFYNFFGDNKWQLIAGGGDGKFYGYQWNGTGWDSNATVVNGLVDVGTQATPDVFYNLFGDGKWHLISGEVWGNYDGFQWNGTAWNSNATVINGLVDMHQYSTLTVLYNFFGDEKWHLISGGDVYATTGYQWTGSGWTSNATVINGFDEAGFFPTFTVFYNGFGDNKWNMIVGRQHGTFYGFEWTGSAWTSDDTVVNGLGDVGGYSAPDVFYNLTGDSKWNLISGNEDGTFNGSKTLYVAPEPIISLISVTPDPINTNYTGTITISYLVKSDDPLNLSSLAFLYGLNYTIPAGGDMYNYISAPSNDIAYDGIYRAPHRNLTPYLSWEDNATITEGNVWKWGGYDNDSTEVSISAINATHTWVNVTGVTEDVLPSSFYISKTAMYDAPKTGFEVNRAQGLIFKMWNVEEIRNRNANYFANLYFDSSWESTLPGYPIEIGFCNASYEPATDDIDVSPYCAKFGEWNGTRWVDHSWDPGANASYASPLTVNASDFTDPSPDDTNYIWLRSNTISSKSYVLNATNYDPGITNISFAQTETFWTYNELTGVTTAQAYTPSFFTTFVRNDEDLLHHLYIADTEGEWGHSEIFSEAIGVSSIPVSAVSFEYFNVSCGDEYVNDTLMDANYDDGNVDIHIHFPADPDGGDVTHNITLHHADNETFIAVINDSITTTGDEYLDISFSTTPYYSGTNYYTLRCISTDDEGSVATKWLVSDFTLDADGNQGWATDDAVLFWGMNDIPTLYSTISNNSLISYDGGSDIYTMHKPFFKAKCNDTFDFSETVHLKSLNNEDVAYFRYWGSVVFDNATILAWNTTLDSPAPITDTYRGYVYTYFHAEGNITNSNFSYLGSDFYRQEGLNFVEITDDYLIHNTTFSNNAEGIVMEECTDFTISDSTITDNVNVGVGVYFTNSTTIENSTITSNGGRGVSIYEGNDNIIQYNDITNSGLSGIHSWANSNNNTYTGNNVTTSTNYDYYFTSSASDNYIIDTASSNDLIRLTSTCDVNVENSDNAAFVEDSSKTSYAYLTNFSMYVGGITETFNITQTGMIVTPSTDDLSVWNIDQIGNFSFNASSDTADNPTWFNITNISWANHNVAVYRNGTAYADETADDNGLMDYNYTGGYSEKFFEFVLGGISNYDNFTFSNAAINPTAVRENSPFTVSVDINDGDGTITEALVKISGNNYTMAQSVGDTWSYIFTDTSLPTEYYVTDFYAKDNNNAWNSTTSTLTIDVVSSTGTGGTGGISPVVTPTVVPAIELIPEVIEVKISNVTEAIKRMISEDVITVFRFNFNFNSQILEEKIFMENSTRCTFVSYVITSCTVEDEFVSILISYHPDEMFYTHSDSITVYEDGISQFREIDIYIINLTNPVWAIMFIILSLVIFIWRRSK